MGRLRIMEIEKRVKAAQEEGYRRGVEDAQDELRRSFVRFSESTLNDIAKQITSAQNDQLRKSSEKAVSLEERLSSQLIPDGICTSEEQLLTDCYVSNKDRSEKMCSSAIKTYLECMHRTVSA